MGDSVSDFISHSRIGSRFDGFHSSGVKVSLKSPSTIEPGMTKEMGGVDTCFSFNERAV